MKSIKQQYIDLMEGRMSQHNFMRSLRMTMPQYVTNVTSFKDSVRILKNKGILSEAMDVKDEDEEFIDMIAKAEEEEAGKYTKFDDFEGGLSEDDNEEEASEDPDMFDAYGMDASEGKINEGRKKKEPKAELHPNQIHPQELRMGIKVELEHTDDLDKAKKIALDHLAENPFYYTALKLSGIESPSAPKAKYPVEKKAKKKKEAVEMVDAANQMQKVKMPKVVKENLNEGGEWTITGTLTKDEQTELKNMIGNYELDVQATDDTLETTISHPMYNDKSLEQALKQVRGMLTPSKDKKDLGGSFDKFKSQLESLVREVLDEI
jgi:hypothetical protein